MPSSPRSAKPRPDLLLTIEGAEVRFEWRGDRWAHAVRFDPAAGGSMVGLWHSIEGPGDTSGDDDGYDHNVNDLDDLATTMVITTWRRRWL